MHTNMQGSHSARGFHVHATVILHTFSLLLIVNKYTLQFSLRGLKKAVITNDLRV